MLQDAEFTKLGSNKRIQVDVRIVAATNRDLEKCWPAAISVGRILYYRLKVIELTVPRCASGPTRSPRSRISSSPTLEAQPAGATDFRRTAPAVRDLRVAGNIRELENMIKRVVILQDEQLVVREIQRNMQRVRRRPSRLRRSAGRGSRGGRRGALPVGLPMPPPSYAPAPTASTPTTAATMTMRRRRRRVAGGGRKAASMKAERAAIETTLRQVHWNRRKAAQILGVSYKTLLNKIKECGISRA